MNDNTTELFHCDVIEWLVQQVLFIIISGNFVEHVSDVFHISIFSVKWEEETNQTDIT